MDKQPCLAHDQSRFYRQTSDFNISKNQLPEVGSLSETVKYQQRSVLTVDPYVRSRELAKNFSATLTELTTKERQLALEYTINTVNESVVEPKLHIAFASPLIPLEDWKEQFNQLRNDPEIQKAKRKMASNIILKDNVSKRVLEQLRRILPGEKFDQLKRQHSNQLGRNPLIRLIDASDVVGDISPKQLVNAIQNAGYRMSVLNFSHLIHPAPVVSENVAEENVAENIAENSLIFQPLTPYLARNSTGRQSWPSRDSARSSSLKLSHSLRRASSTNVYSLDTSSSNGSNTLQLQRSSVFNNKTVEQKVEQKKAWQHLKPVYSVAPVLADAGNCQGSHSCSQDIHVKATPSEEQPDIAKECRCGDRFSLKSHYKFPQFHPSTGTSTNSIASRYSLATATTDPVSKPSRKGSTQLSSPENKQEEKEKKVEEKEKKVEEKEDIMSQQTMTLNQRQNQRLNSLSTTATSGYGECVVKPVGNSTCIDTKQPAEKYATPKPEPEIHSGNCSDSLYLSNFRSDNLSLPLSTLDQHSGGHYWTSSLDCAELKTLRRGITLSPGYSIYKRKEEDPSACLLKEEASLTPFGQGEDTHPIPQKDRISEIVALSPANKKDT